MVQTRLIQEFSRPIRIPNSNPFFRQCVTVRRTSNKPKQLLSNSSPKYTLRGEERENIVSKTEAHLCPKLGEGPCPSTIGPRNPMFKDLFDQVEVLIFLMDFLPSPQTSRDRRGAVHSIVNLECVRDPIVFVIGIREFWAKFEGLWDAVNEGVALEVFFDICVINGLTSRMAQRKIKQTRSTNHKDIFDLAFLFLAECQDILKVSADLDPLR
mmetsp:Transcript_11760/g.17835  ORF Transcript_11760/g.17835 Transcript_11760/m.17835 type:complete len:212 (+) Transcript_11760:606-1241(+)